ncbi:hypothetical protein ITJ86_05675 [Winogradskyella sp. F6397]|uniref:Outer membrane protein beta-barrel domain-containing protein n=1 Tax=Winogradskyella marina TaxID=2785530 RepID=A0ABS0EFZ8_9FLAO|nr:MULTISPECIES: hypothetical protein [Winogradskyella]MBF8149376.1 hypothetical protein [Winogradskyella marina]
MKTSLLLFIFSLSILTATAQDASVEQSTYGIQFGFLGFWGHNESKLSNSIALRSELGIDAGFYSNSFIGSSGFVLVPAITFEPRWYYNLNKRVSKSRRIDGNSGNFIAIKTTYHPDIVINSVANNLNFISDISIIPTWGIRRNVGKHFTYETGIGLGYIHYIKEENVYLSDSDGFAINLHLRIGYRF